MGACLLRIASLHNNDITMWAMVSQITNLTIVYSTVNSGADQRKHPISTPLAFVRGIHRWPVNSPHKWPVTRKMFHFDDVIMSLLPIVFAAWRWMRTKGQIFRSLKPVSECMWQFKRTTVSNACLLTVCNYSYSHWKLLQYQYIQSRCFRCFKGIVN